MHYIFDIISDTYIETWPDLDLSMIATSPYCIIAGGIGSHREEVMNFLTDIQQSYQGIFYIDGDDEHYHELPFGLNNSYKDLKATLQSHDELVYLHHHVVVSKNVAIVGINGWWNFAFNPAISPEQAIAHWCETYSFTLANAEDVIQHANNDAVYLRNTLIKLQSMKEVEKIIVVSHTVPLFELIYHDPRINYSYQSSLMGNNQLEDILDDNLTDKIHTWIFGHYGGDIDQTINGIRFINNCRNAASDIYAKNVYNPKRLSIKT